MKFWHVAHLTLEKISVARLAFGWARNGHLTILSFAKVYKYKTDY